MNHQFESKLSTTPTGAVTWLESLQKHIRKLFNMLLPLFKLG